MKVSHRGRSSQGARRKATTPPGVSRAGRDRRASANALADRERVVGAREEAAHGREAALARHAAALGVHGATAPPTSTEIGRLMDRMREANARLTIAAVRAHDLLDEANEEATQAKRELDEVMTELRDANERVAAAAAHAHTMAVEAGQREEKYRLLSSRLLTLQDDERRRLAFDLHDSTAQQLAALLMNLDMVTSTRHGLDLRSRQALAESRALAEECCRDVRTLSYLLHPPLLDVTGLSSAVRWYADGFSQRSGIDVALDLGEIGRLPRPIETALFRIVQESLTNVHRHASTTTATIRLTTSTDAIVLEIEDQGRGLQDQPTHGEGAPATLGVGIQGMRERIRQFGGNVAVEFTDRGTTVRVCVPLKRELS